MKKYDVTFPIGDNGAGVVTRVEAPTRGRAAYKARQMNPQLPPDAQPSDVREVRRGNPGTPRVAEPRSVRLMTRYTPTERDEIERRAKEAGESLPEYQRRKVLS